MSATWGDVARHQRAQGNWPRRSFRWAWTFGALALAAALLSILGVALLPAPEPMDYDLHLSARP